MEATQISEGAGLAVIIAIWAVAILAYFLLAIIPSKIAKKKGYSGVGFYFFGLAAFVPAIIVACVLRNKNAAPAQPQAAPPQEAKLNGE